MTATFALGLVQLARTPEFAPTLTDLGADEPALAGLSLDEVMRRYLLALCRCRDEAASRILFADRDGALRPIRKDPGWHCSRSEPDISPCSEHTEEVR